MLFLLYIINKTRRQIYKNRDYNSYTYQYNKIIFFITTIFLCLFLCFSYCKYHNDKQMTYVSNFKESEKWDEMLLHLDKLYFTSLFSLDNTSTPIQWYYGIYYYYQKNHPKSYDVFHH